MLSASSFAILAVIVLAGMLPLLKGKQKRYCENALIVVCSACTLLFFSQLLKADGRPAKLQSLVAEERAESVLKFMSTINVGVAKVYEIFVPIEDSMGQKHHALEMDKTGLKSYLKNASNSLQAAIKGNPEKAALKAKLIVLLSLSGKQKELTKSTCLSLKSSKTEGDKHLGEVLWKIYVEPDSRLAASELDTIAKGLPRGWYQDHAITAFYKTTKQFKELGKFTEQLEERYSNTFILGLLLVLGGCFSAFVGLVVIIIQLGSMSRKDSIEHSSSLGGHELGLDISLRSVYAVFVGWIAAQMAITEVLKLMPKNLLSMGQNPVGVSSFSFVAYLLTMLPALVLIYLVALRPCGLNLLDAMRLSLKTAKYGPLKLIFCGYLSWCAIIPLVLLSSSIATYMGSQGSDNPILPQIAMIASSKNLLAILILGSAVAVLAPICEEIIFRGFLYSSLRHRIGMLPALLISSIIFAGIHFDKGGALMLLALGPVLVMALERTRSLWPSMIAHGLWNGGTFAITLALFFT